MSVNYISANTDTQLVLYDSRADAVPPQCPEHSAVSAAGQQRLTSLSASVGQPTQTAAVVFVRQQLQLLTVPHVRRSTLSDRAFSVVAPRAWNSLPSAICASTSLITFQWELKTSLYHLRFDEH